MTALELYNKAFIDSFGIKEEDLNGIEYQSIPAWDSAGHMNLVSALENAFDIMMDTDDIIDFSSYEKGKRYLPRTIKLSERDEIRQLCWNLLKGV